MSKYDNEYKLYCRRDNTKVQLGYFMFNFKEGKEKDKIKILIPN